MTIQKRRKKRATKAEQAVATSLGGRRTFLSGAGDEKGDVIVGGGGPDVGAVSLRVEVKTTTKSSYTLSSKDWKLISSAADRAGQVPAFVMEIGVGSIADYCKIVAIRTSFFNELMEFTPLGISNKPRRSIKITKGSAHTRVEFVGGPKSDLTLMEWAQFTQKIDSLHEHAK